MYLKYLRNPSETVSFLFHWIKDWHVSKTLKKIKEGLTKDIKRRAYYEKPSERKQRAARKSVKRVQQIGQPGPARRPRSN